jgi:microsomal dipeptidase-like Zn-dependent dipeptidase
MTTKARTPSLSAEEARQLHEDALVIDSQQPPATSGFLFTDDMKLAERGFNEEELRKLLGLNYLRYFREVVG